MGTSRAWFILVLISLFALLAGTGLSNSDEYTLATATVPSVKEFNSTIEKISSLSSTNEDSAALRALEEFKSRMKNLSSLQLATLQNEEGVILRRLGDYTRSISLLFDAKANLTEDQGPELLTKINNNLGVGHRRIDKYAEALKYHLNALDLAKKHKDQRSELIALNGIGNIHLAFKQYDKSLTYFREGLTAERKLKNQRGEAINLNNIGIVYEEQEAFDSALFYYNASLALNQQMGNNFGQSICLNCLGNVFKKQEDFSQALKFYFLALEIPISDLRMQLETKLNIGSIYSITGFENKALEMIDEVIQQAEKANQLSLLLKANEILFEHFVRKSSIEKIKYYHHQVIKTRDSIVGKKAKIDVQLISARYDAAEKQEKILELEEAQEDQTIYFMVYGFGLLVLSLLIILFLIQRKNTKIRKSNETLAEALKEKNLLLSEVHHRVKNNLAVVSSILQLQELNANSDEVEVLLAKNQNRIKVLALVYETLYEDGINTKCDMQHYLKSFEEFFIQTFIADDQIELSITSESLILEPNNAIPLAILIFECVDNALKHGKTEARPLKIDVCLEKAKDQIRLTVANDGIPLPEDFRLNSFSSMGAMLIDLYIQQLKAKLSLSTKEGFTTVFEVLFSRKKMKTWR